MALSISTLTDSFHGTLLGTTKWGGVFGTVSESSSGVTITNAAHYTSFGGFTSNSFYDLTGDQATTHLVDAGNQAIASWDVRPVMLSLDSTHAVWWDLQANVLRAWVPDGSGGFIALSGTLAYSAGVHNYFRIREASGTTYWDWSTDGVSWTNFKSTANPFSMTSVQVLIAAGETANEATGTAATFDNFNIIPSISPISPHFSSVIGGQDSILGEIIPGYNAPVEDIIITSPTLQFMIPLYIYPTVGTFWTDLAAHPQNVAYVIANPASGPGTSANHDYVTGINNLRAAGIKVLGFVDTNYAAVPLSFPTVGVLDNFNRTAENPISDSGAWATTAPNGNQVGQTEGTVATGILNGIVSGAGWNTPFSLPVEVYFDLPAIPGTNHYIQALWLTSPSAASPNGYGVTFRRTSGAQTWSIDKWTAGTVTSLASGPLAGLTAMLPGDSYGMSITADGLITAWRKGASTSWGALGQVVDTTYTGAGYVGFLSDSGPFQMDNFAGGTGAPTVEKQMDDWANWYSIDGYFLDRANNVAGSESYYSTLNAYAKSKNAAWVTANNYGTTMPFSYYATCDINVNTEETEAHLQSNFEPLQGWELGQPSSHFAEIIYSCTLANLESDIALVTSRNAQYVWLAQDALYQTEPSYWRSTLQDLNFPETPTPPATVTFSGGVGEQFSVPGAIGLALPPRVTLTSPSAPSSFDITGYIGGINSGLVGIGLAYDPRDETAVMWTGMVKPENGSAEIYFGRDNGGHEIKIFRSLNSSPTILTKYQAQQIIWEKGIVFVSRAMDGFGPPPGGFHF